METSFEPGVFDPAELEDEGGVLHSLAFSPPGFRGNYTEIDEPLDGDGLEENEFLRRIRDDVVAKIHGINFGTLRKKDNGTDAFVSRRLTNIDADPKALDHPEYFISFAQLLFNNGRHDEAEAILLYEYDGEKRERWPHNAGCVLLLAEIAMARGENERVISILTDIHGNLRFPDHIRACQFLARALNICRKHQQTLILLDSRQTMVMMDPSLMHNYIVALNTEQRYQDVIELFGSLEKLPRFVRLQPGIIGSIGFALNAVRSFRRAFEFMQPFSQKTDFQDTPIYVVALTYCLNELGEHERSISLLMEKNGRYRFPDDTRCMRSLGYALINAGRILDAEHLLEWVEHRSNFSPQILDEVARALERKRRTLFTGRRR